MNNTNKYISILIIILLASFLLGACTPATSAADDAEDSLQITVSILPQAYFVERIGGERVSVNVMVGPGEEAHTYEPKPEQMRALADSAVFFSIGVEYEDAWIPRFGDVNPEIVIIDSTAGIERIPMTHAHSHDDHDEDEGEEEHGHEDETGLDPHVWLSPENGKQIATNIFNALVELAPKHETEFQANYDALIRDIKTLDDSIQSILEGVENQTFMVFHPAWGYFAKQYDLEQVPVQVGGQDPSASELAELIEIATEENIRVIFIQPTFNAANARAIADEINAEIAVADPLSRDWLKNLEAVAEAFAEALRP